MRRLFRKVFVVVVMSAVLLLTLLAVRRLAGFEGYDPYWIDYDQPGIDITREGP